MRTIALALAATAALAVSVVSAAPATADERRCYTPHVAGQDSFEVCYYVPIGVE